MSLANVVSRHYLFAFDRSLSLLSSLFVCVHVCCGRLRARVNVRADCIFFMSIHMHVNSNTSVHVCVSARMQAYVFALVCKCECEYLILGLACVHVRFGSLVYRRTSHDLSIVSHTSVG